MTAARGSATATPPGVDLPALERWFAERVGKLSGPLQLRLIPGGKSNLTYAATDGHQQWVLRRPPLGHVLASAHDMSREYRVMAALRETDVPVPTTIAYCDDQSVIGSSFYVMEFVEGAVHRRADDLRPLGRERARAISTDLVDTLARLHAVDPARVGLADMGRVDGFLGRQVRRWGQQLDSSHSRELPGADELRRLLAQNVPTESAAGVVHGDYSMSNALVAEDRIAAVLDWEMATIGDPVTDLALLILYHRLGRQVLGDTISDVATAPGFLTEDEVIDQYTRETSRDLSDLSFYLGLAAFKLATITEGIHYRFINGQTVGAGFTTMGAIVPPLLEMGLDYMKADH